jgi:hypothetical protein
MTEQRSTNQTKFVVDLGNLELPPIIERQIESEIRAVVLKALANPELGVARRLEPSIFRRFPGETLGLWIDPDHPEEGTWEDTVPGISGRSGEDMITPFATHNMAVFLSSLASTKAGGAEAIRISRVKDDLHLEQLDARGRTIMGFVLHPITNAKKKVTAVAITRKGSSGAIESLGTEERAALAAIVDELSQMKESSAPGVIFFWHQFWEAVGAGVACGLAAVEGGANPVADGECILATGNMLGGDDDE